MLFRSNLFYLLPVPLLSFPISAFPLGKGAYQTFLFCNDVLLPFFHSLYKQKNLKENNKIAEKLYCLFSVFLRLCRCYIKSSGKRKNYYVIDCYFHMLQFPHREDGGGVLDYAFIFCAVRKCRIGSIRKTGVLGGVAPAQATNKRRMGGNEVDVHSLCLLVSGRLPQIRI